MMDPKEEVELGAKCTGLCSGVKYTWKLKGYLEGIDMIQTLNEYTYLPNADNKTFIIKKNLMVYNSPYPVNLKSGNDSFH